MARLFKTPEEQPLKWSVGSGTAARFDDTSPEGLKGTIEVPSGKSIYVTLGTSPGNFQSLKRGTGMKVTNEELHLLSLERAPDNNIKHSLLVLEYNAAGERIGTARSADGMTMRYRPGPGVDRVVITLRAKGSGKLVIRRLSWRCESEIFKRGLAVSAHRQQLDFSAVNGRPIFLDESATAPPFTIWPNGSVKLSLFGLDPGRYFVELFHRDALLASATEGLTAHFHFASPIEGGPRPESLGFKRDENGFLGTALPVVSRKSGLYRHAAHFTLLDRQDWLVAELGLGLDRLINVDRAAVKRVPTTGSAQLPENLFAERVNNFLATIENPEEIEFIVFAEISVNVVDGSSVWLSSILSMLTEMGRCLLVSRVNVESEIVLSNVRNRERLTVLSPIDVRFRRAFTANDAAHIIRRLDDRLPRLRNIVVRGCAVAQQLFETRRFRERGFAYLTDFYEVGADGLIFPDDKVAAVRLAATQAAKLLVQTEELGSMLRTIAGRDFASFALPPSIPALALPAPDDMPAEDGTIRIGYAGKINPQWGVVELLDWTEALRERGMKVELTIVANKIADRSGTTRIRGFKAILLERFEALGVTFLEDLNREQSMSLMNTMDFVWCWRPGALEDQTLELSTKLIEMAAQGARCICYPNAINREVLGQDYPFFASDIDDVATILSERNPRPMELAEAVDIRFSQNTIGRRLAEDCLNRPADRAQPRILISGNGLKFVEPYASHLKARGHHVTTDHWEWGASFDLRTTAEDAEKADLIFCEWGLANAVWHSKNLRPGQRLLVRCHAQEVRDKALKFGRQINVENVEKFIFVSERVRRKAIELFGWPEEKTVLVPNFLLDDEYRLAPANPDRANNTAADGTKAPIQIGLVGMIPQSKRFDRALDLLAELSRRGVPAELRVKGQRPEKLDYMFAPGRAAEMKYFLVQYDRIENDPLLRGKVVFDGWGNDMAEWYARIDHVLSPSDHESFHYAVADGALCGCDPLIWPWEEADRIYPGEWIVADAAAAAQRIVDFSMMDSAAREEQLQANREALIARYGYRKIYQQLDAVLGLV